MALCGIPMTFKQQVEEILADDTGAVSTNKVNAILSTHNAELDRMLRPCKHTLYAGPGRTIRRISRMIDCPVCMKAYIQAQKGS